VREFLLSFGAESLVSQVAIQKHKDRGIQNYNFACCFCWYVTWSFAMGKKCRLRVFENSLLRRIFEPKRDEVAREWGRLPNEGLYDQYSSQNTIRMKSRKIRWAGHVACMGKRRGE
jgi:hypothetical protein